MSFPNCGQSSRGLIAGRELRARAPRIPIIAISGGGADDTGVDLLKAAVLLGAEQFGMSQNGPMSCELARRIPSLGRLRGPAPTGTSCRPLSYLKPLALTAALLILAGCNASNPTAPTSAAGPSFDHVSTGCPVATAKTATGTPGAAGGDGVALGCSLGN